MSITPFVLNSSSTNNVSNGFIPIPNLILSADGTKFYGACEFGGSSATVTNPGYGTIFSLSLDFLTFNVLYNFKPTDSVTNPISNGLTLVGNVLYGIGSNTVNGGLFGFTIDGTSLTYKHVIDDATNGANPSGLVYSQQENILYGNGYNGGVTGLGTLFSIDLELIVKTKIHDFNFTNGENGSHPNLVLLDNDALLCTCNTGGTNNLGTVFYYPLPVGLNRRKLVNFNGTNGSHPTNTLINIGGLYYGTTRNGGHNNNDGGTIFSLSLPIPSSSSVLYSFNGTLSNPKINADGMEPNSALININNILYGTCSFGGNIGYGCIFGIPIGGSQNVINALYSFGQNINGFLPGSTLITDSSNTILYGTCPIGGSNNNFLEQITFNNFNFLSNYFNGTIFKFSIPVPCYAKGSQILTENGYKNIEDIIIGEKIQTKGDIKNHKVFMKNNIKKVINIKHFILPIVSLENSPIIIKKNAIQKNMPHSDIVVSPDHGIYIPQVSNLSKFINIKNNLLNAKYLLHLNDNIYQDETYTEIEYYHIELESHSIIVAQGLLAESFIDNTILQ